MKTPQEPNNPYLRLKPDGNVKATSRGWEDADTGELLVAIKDLDKKVPVAPVKRGRGRPRKYPRP